MDSDGGRHDGDLEFDRAVGPMQFIPTTWSRWGRDGNGDGVADPQNIFDAALAAAHYLCSGPGGLDTDSALTDAYLRYNQSRSYALKVLGHARWYQSDAGALRALRSLAPDDLALGCPTTPQVIEGSEVEPRQPRQALDQGRVPLQSERHQTALLLGLGQHHELANTISGGHRCQHQLHATKLLPSRRLATPIGEVPDHP